MATARFISAALLFASAALAKTDLEGCTYYDSVIDPGSAAPYNTRIWYVPDSGEVCAFLDCGGGRAPPKTNVPGCFLYEGTDTYSPSYIDLKTLGIDVPASATASSTSGSESEPAPTSGTASSTATDTATTNSGRAQTTAGPETTTTTKPEGGDESTSTSTTAASTPNAAAPLQPAAAVGPLLMAGVAAAWAGVL